MTQKETHYNHRRLLQCTLIVSFSRTLKETHYNHRRLLEYPLIVEKLEARERWDQSLEDAGSA